MNLYHALKWRALLSTEGLGKIVTDHQMRPFFQRLCYTFSRKSVRRTSFSTWNIFRKRDGCLLVTLCAVPFAAPSKSTQNLMKLEEVDSDSLTHRSLLRNASSAVVTSASTLVSQSLMTMNELNTQYIKELYALVRLYHEHNAVAGQQLGTMEDDIWQEIIEARTKLDQRKRAMQEVETVLTSAILVLQAAGETAYHSGVEYSALEAKTKCQQTQEY
ncbi:diablo IAP-binding mitochondrial protein-like isoform X2 [Apostichopus japonicus]